MPFGQVFALGKLCHPLRVCGLVQSTLNGFPIGGLPLEAQPGAGHGFAYPRVGACNEYGFHLLTPSQKKVPYLVVEGTNIAQLRNYFAQTDWFVVVFWRVCTDRSQAACKGQSTGMLVQIFFLKAVSFYAQPLCFVIFKQALHLIKTG